ncbi:MAG: LPS export ABC transporter permease LptG [Gammaproteobacteria bacterium]|nr:LPS export ABC transporter permease LptG [Gammaproteobacteria bacterium]
MSQVDRYLFRSVVSATLLVLLLLLSLQTLISFIFELESVGRGRYTTVLAGVYVLLKLPGLLYEYFPSAVLIGSLLGLGALSSNNELIVMRTSGVSVWRLLFGVLKTGLFLVAIAVTVGEYWAPQAERYSQQMRLSALSERVSLKAREGLWVRAENRFINVRAILPDLVLRNVTIFEYHDDSLHQIIRAELARPLPDKSWQLHNMTYTRIDAETGQNTLEVIEREVWSELIDRGLFDLLAVKSRTQSAAYLKSYVEYLQKNKLDASNYQLEFWRRISVPFSILVMLMLSLPFVFQPSRSANTGQRLLIGIVLGVAYFLAERLIGRMGLVYGLSPIVSALVAPFLFSVMAAWGIRRVNNT